MLRRPDKRETKSPALLQSCLGTHNLFYSLTKEPQTLLLILFNSLRVKPYGTSRAPLLDSRFY